MQNIKHTPEFDLAYRFVTETNLNLFLTGKAGTGKTTFLKYLRENSFKKMVVAAPTGVAAINAGGVTLHSLFHLPFAPFIPGPSPTLPQKGREHETDSSFSPLIGRGAGGEAFNSSSLLSKIHYSNEKLTLFRNLELLVIDEASMVAGHTVDAIDTILKSVRRKHRIPFGGVQVLFIGDLHQLQPVVKNDEWQFLKEYYSSIFFFDSIVLREHVPVMIELKEIFRQKDETFVDILNEVRNNDLSRKNFDLLNTRLQSAPLSFGEGSGVRLDTEGYITLTTHNNQADRINKGKLQKLEARSQTFKAEIHGDYPEHLYPAEALLELKEGSQVMFLKNDNEGKKYFNGKLGTVTRLNDSVIRVKCKGETAEIEVKKYEWKNISYRVNKDTREITEEELGSFSQYPLRLAWAITIHKSQGLTFDKLIIDSGNAFANGQVYVALSRCTSLEGLILTSPINQQFLGAHQNLEEWKREHHSNPDLQGTFDESRKNFVMQELQNIFTFNKWADELRDLKTVMQELKEELPQESFSWLNELMNKQAELQEIAEKFKDEMNHLSKENPVAEENPRLQERIKKAATYFSSNMNTWKENFHKHTLSTDTKKNSKQIDAALEAINGTIQETLHKINYCKNGFLLDTYLKHGRKLTTPIEKMQSSYAQNQTKNIIADDAVHIGLYDRLSEMRKRIAGEKNVALYEVFNNAAIKNVCSGLPATKDVLLKVKGFGKVKVKQFGDEVIELVHEYCDEHNIEPHYHIEGEPKVRKKKEKTESADGITGTVEQTVTLFKQGKSITEISKERNFAPTTIEGHLGQAVGRGLVNIEDLMTMEEVKKIAPLFPENLQDIKLGEIISRAPSGITYGKLKMVLGWLQRESR